MSGNVKMNGYWAGLPHRGIALISLTIKQILLNKYLPLAFVFLLIPSVIALYTIFNPPKDYDALGMFVDVSLFIFFQFFVLIYCLIYGSSLMHDELEKQTMTYLITRSSKRLEIVIFKFIGLIISVNILFIVSVSLCYFLFTIQGDSGDLVNGLDHLFYICLIMFLGSLGYGALFTFFSIRFKRPLMVGLLFAFVWEIFITNIPFNVRRVTLMYYLRSLLFHKVHYGSILEFTKPETVGFSVGVIIVVTLFFIALSCWLMSRKEIH